MGQAPSTSQPEAPSRPYEGTTKRRRWKIFHLSSSRREPRKLTSLILLQDWQKVLVRAKLFPHEISHTISMQLYGLPLRLLPLHLACALDPPVVVVSLFLKLHPEAATTAVTVIEKKTPSRTLRRPFRALRKYRRLAGRDGSGRRRSEPPPSIPEQYPTSGSTSNSSLTVEVQKQSLLNRHPVVKSRWLPQRHLVPSDCGDSSLWGTDHGDEPTGSYDLDGPSLMESMSTSLASSSRQSSYTWNDSGSLLNQKGVILQLSPSGGISPFPIGSQETDSTTETLSQGAALSSSTTPLFGVQWDLTPLWESMANAPSAPDNSLLPCHVATLYQASPAVLKQLLDAHPMGAVCSILGMLPIHMCSAGWVLEPWVAPPPPPPSNKDPKLGNNEIKQPLQPYHHHHERHPSRVKDILTVLREVLPESVRIRSGNHGMTPVQYIAEAMEDCPQKEECLSLLMPGEGGEDGTIEVKSLGPFGYLTELADTSPSLIFMDSYEAAPEIPFEIHYSSTDFAATQEAPKTKPLSSLLMAQDWEGALSTAEEKPQEAQEWFDGCGDQLDPTIEEIHPDDEDSGLWKRLALHLACRYRAPVGLVEVLLQAHPQAVTSPDPTCGSLPLHLACEYKSSYRVVKSLLMHTPTTSKAVDTKGRLPLHHAVLAKAHYAIVELLIEVDPTSALAFDKHRQTPLDLAKVAYGPKNAVVRLLEMVTLVLTKAVVSMPSWDAGSHGQDTVCF